MAERPPLLRALWVLPAVGIPALLVYVCFRQIDVAALVAGIERVQPPYLVLGAVVISTMILIGATEWKLLLPSGAKVPLLNLVNVFAVMLFLQNTVHHFAGQALAIYRLGHRERLGKSIALSILATDQLAEGLARLLMLAGLALVIELPPWAVTGIESILVSVFLLYIVLLVFAWRHRELEVQAPTAGGWQKAKYHLSVWAHNLHGVRDLRITALAVLLALMKKVVRAAGLYCVQQSVTVDLPWYAPLVIIAALDLATMVSVTPGHLGIFEAIVYFMYHEYFGIEPGLAMTMALFYHMVALLAVATPGLCISVHWGFRRQVLGASQLSE